MGGRGSSSGAKGGGASRSISFSPTRTTDISEKLNGKTLSLSRGTITIKGENGKTSGLVRMDRVSDMAPRDKFEVKSAADKSGVSLTDNGMSNFYYDKGSKQLYFMNNTSSNYLYENEKGSTLVGYGDYVSKQTTLRAMESKGVIVVNHK